MGVPGKASQRFSKLVPKLLFRLVPHPSVLCREAKSSDFTLPAPCQYDILLVCQHPHALSRNRLVPALAGRTNAA